MRYTITTTVSERMADTVTAVGAFLQIRQRFPGSLLLESSDYHGEENSFSYLCFDPLATIEMRRDEVEYHFPDGSCEIHRSAEVPLQGETRFERNIKDFRARFVVDSCALGSGIVNGLFGFFAYDAVELMEEISLQGEPQPSEAIPLSRYTIYRYVLAIDHFHNRLTILVNSCDAGKASDPNLPLSLLSGTIPLPGPFTADGPNESLLSDDEHREAIARCKEHIQRGDVFQIVYSRKFRQRFSGDDFQVYRALRSINPSPYLFYLDGGEFHIFGSSPEAQLIVREGRATIVPIAGSCPRTIDEERDREAVERLRNDPKESAEHVMLVDLARNDLSIHCYPVSVERFKETQIYSHIIHLVSRVEGTLLPGRDPLSVLAATAPAGTLSGAPKYKSMELIDRYERGRRQFYGGAIGYIGFSGDVNHAIMIRTILSREGVLHTQAGGGIVADSVPDAEVAEVWHKLGAMRAAIERGAELAREGER